MIFRKKRIKMIVWKLKKIIKLRRKPTRWTMLHLIGVTLQASLNLIPWYKMDKEIIVSFNNNQILQCSIKTPSIRVGLVSYHPTVMVHLKMLIKQKNFSSKKVRLKVWVCLEQKWIICDLIIDRKKGTNREYVDIYTFVLI